MRCVSLLIAVALVAFAAKTVFACSCAAEPPPKEALKRAKAVFIGKVIKIEEVGKLGRFGAVKATIEVSINYKGVKTKQVEVWTTNDQASCGYLFEKGSSYLVYCYGYEKKLLTSICSRTRNMKNAKADIEVIGPGKIVKAEKE